MDTAKLKNFAQYARRSLLEQVTAKMNLVLAGDSAARREQPGAVEELEKQIDSHGREQVIEKIAYTWFNRFCALRFMDVNRYTRVGVVSPAEGQFQPEILAEAKMGHIDEEMVTGSIRQRIFALLDGKIPSHDPQGEAYRLMVVAACNYWNGPMPFLFEKIADYTELLMPDDLLSDSSILTSTRETLTPDVCKDVEVIGWLYQFYISEKKDAVMARKSAVPTEDIPAVTQLFTPHWIVRYLVENSLGRLWLLNRPGSRLREHMPYYIEGEPETDFLKITKPEEIRLCDPACGSGHMLTYAFDLLYAIYEEEGYEPAEIPALILRHNLHGVEICPRAAQLAGLALVFKARAKSRRFFQPEHLVRPNIIELIDVCFTENELREYIHGLGLGDLFNQSILKLLHQFEEAKNFGSLIQPCLDEGAIADMRRAIEAKDLGGQLFLRDTHLKVLRVLEQAETLTQRYHVVVANPPYMGQKQMNPRLKTFVEEHLNAGKSDLFAAFTLRNLNYTLDSGFIGMITIPNWMFLESFEDLRKQLLNEVAISTLIHNGRGLWGADFGSCAFVLHKTPLGAGQGSYKRLFSKPSEVNSPEVIEERFLDDRHFPWLLANTEEFKSIPGYPIAYWISPKVRLAFSAGRPLSQFGDARQGLATADNDRFLRLWFEPSSDRLRLRCRNREEARASLARWFPYNKGGAFRKWYGNSDHLIDWEDDGKVLFGLRPKSVIRSPDKYFLPSLSWSKVTIGAVSFRAFDAGYLFDVAGCSFFPSQQISANVVAGYLNSPVVRVILGVLSPTMNYEVGHISKLPVLDKRIEDISGAVSNLVTEAIIVARADWDNFETSWDFRDEPLLRPELKGATLEASWRNWEAQSTAAIHLMQELETENNRLFIAAYGLEGELQPEVPEDQITLARADKLKDMAAFISYAVGCMFGRYSLDKPGLILANQGETIEDYLKQVAEPTFMPDHDNVLPLMDVDWFTDDIAERFKEFLKVTFGKELYEENLKFIEQAIGKDIRKYFLKDFYNDHVKRYKKRPIYWLFSSPKGSFNALIYMHRYRPDTVSIVLNDYLREFRTKLTSRKNHLEAVSISGSASPAEKTKALKEIEILKNMIAEMEEYEREVLYPLATRQLAIDLDDGVKVNYLKFGPALKKIAGLDKGEEE